MAELNVLFFYSSCKAIIAIKSQKYNKLLFKYHYSSRRKFYVIYRSSEVFFFKSKILESFPLWLL